MILLRGETKELFLVIWGDYQLWVLGFKDEKKASVAERYCALRCLNARRS